MVLGREFTLGTPGNSVSGDFKLGLAIRPENGAELQSVLNAPVSIENIIPMGYYENNTFTLSAAVLYPPLSGLEASGRVGEGASFCSAGTNRHCWPRPGTVLSPRACKGQ